MKEWTGRTVRASERGWLVGCLRDDVTKLNMTVTGEQSAVGTFREISAPMLVYVQPSPYMLTDVGKESSNPGVGNQF